MEIGSFIELQMPNGMEYYKGNCIEEMEIARLNTGRAAIFHAVTVAQCETIWLPYYQCETVMEFLIQKGIKCKFYHIDSYFNPIDLQPQDNEVVLLVNYYGIMSRNRMRRFVDRFKNVIIDNSQAFFADPIENCLNVYSARKFVGVPDGAYIIGKDALVGVDKYEQGYSSDTALFMLQRIEYGCEGRAYISRTENEERIDTEDCKRMSKLTQYLLDGTDYGVIKRKRRENFEIAHDLFGKINKINPTTFYDNSCVPMVYPLVVEDDGLLDRLLKAKHFQGHWWKWVEENPEANRFEKWISRYMIPVTIDQRYGKEELVYLWEKIIV